jgi:chaperonin GroES
MRVRPLSNLVLLKPLPRANVTDGGIIIPETAKDLARIDKAEVLALGEGLADKPVKVGDIVMLSADLSTGSEVIASVGKKVAAVMVEYSRIMAVIDTLDGIDIQFCIDEVKAREDALGNITDRIKALTS